MENTNAHKNKNTYIVQNYIRSIVVHVLQWFDLNNIYSREKINVINSGVGAMI
jgi:hypothetical protein